MDIPPTLLQVGGPAGILALLIWALVRGWLITSREADDIRAQRDKADARAERILDATVILAEATKADATSKDLATEAVQALKRKVAEDGAES